jgi:hypothetical protein
MRDRAVDDLDFHAAAPIPLLVGGMLMPQGTVAGAAAKG